MQRVILESPLAGDFARNKAYTRLCVRDALLQHGESAYASHLLFDQPGILDDTIQEERELGIQAGFAWHKDAEKTVVYTDFGISSGMNRGIVRAVEACRPLVFRFLSVRLWAAPPERTAQGELVRAADQALLGAYCLRAVQEAHAGR